MNETRVHIGIGVLGGVLAFIAFGVALSKAGTGTGGLDYVLGAIGLALMVVAIVRVRFLNKRDGTSHTLLTG